jgi:hypothetical protein
VGVGAESLMLIRNQQVLGSSPSAGSKHKPRDVKRLAQSANENCTRIIWSANALVHFGAFP